MLIMTEWKRMRPLLSHHVLQVLADLGFTSPTPVQVSLRFVAIVTQGLARLGSNITANHRYSYL